MDFMKGFGKRVTETAKVVGQKTVNVAETVRINNKIAALRDEMGKLYTQIGKEYYKAYHEGATADLSTLCACIDEFQKQIDQFGAQLEEKSDVKRCPSCGAKQPREIKFCPECGAKLSDAPENAEPDPAPTAAEEAKAADVVISWPGAKEEEEAPAEEEQEDQGE